ncbi:MAG: AMP-binding protein [Planctomycetes bacterium]|nr:AMP-binding protein [Planctomycetota bacterium]
MTRRIQTNSRWDKMSRKELQAFQLRRLRHFLAEVVLPFSPHYRARFARLGKSPHEIRSLQDLEAFPFTTKSDVVPSESNPEGPRSFILQPNAELIRTHLPKKALLKIAIEKAFRGASHVEARLRAEYNPVKLLFTTGRSASSLPFFLSGHDLAILRETGRRITQVLGLEPGHDRVVSLFPYAPHLAFWQVAYCAEAAGILTLNTGGGRVMESARIIDSIERLKPTAVCGMPGYFYHLLRRARNEGHEWPFIEKVALGGEMVPSVLKRRIVDTLRDMGASDPKVASVFGFTEARQCWAECTGAEDTGFHTSPDLCLVEIVDPETGRVLGDGESGELVYTTLEGRGSVLFRYRTGDIIDGGITHEACPGCGRTLPRVASRIERVSNVKSLAISKVKGTLVNLNTLAAIIGSDPAIEEWQIVISKANDDPFEVDQIELHCALDHSHDHGAFRERIQRNVSSQTEIHFNQVSIRPLEEMLERVGMERLTKEERIVDRRQVRTQAKEGREA